MTREHRHCAGCGKFHPPHLQNGVLICVCQDCWKQVNMNSKVFTLALAELRQTVDNIDRSLIDVADSMVAALAATKQRDIRDRNEGN